MSTLSNKAYIFRFILATCKRNLNNRRFTSNIHKHSSAAGATKSNKEQQQKQKTGVYSSSSDSKHKYTMDVPEGLFRGVVDRFNGVTVNSNEEFVENVNFADKLQKSLDYWIENGRRGIWFKVITEHSDWIPELTKREFDFHHAKNGYVMLYRWLPKTESANIPVYAHTMLGVGGLVVNDKDEVLVVSDRYALIPNSWKLPGGYVEPRENLVDAAIREVKEETGVETTFDTIISVRQSHGGSFGCSDLYFVIALKPTTSELTACPREISRVAWMSIAEYLEHPNVHETNRQFVKTFLHYKEEGLKFNCVSAIHQVLKRKYCMYSVEKQAPQAET